MGQQDVYDFLKEQKPKEFTAKEISKNLKLSIGSTTTSLMKLRERNSIKYKDGFTTATDGSPRRCLMYRFKGV